MYWVLEKSLLYSTRPSRFIVKFTVPWTEVQTLGWGQYCNLVKIYWILKNILLYSYTYLRKTKFDDSDEHEVFHLNCEIKVPEARVQVLGWGRNGYIV